MIAWVIGLACLNALFYRLGGQGKPFSTRYRDIGCSIITLLICFVLGFKSSLWLTFWAYLIIFGLSWGALASYWSMDEKKWGFWVHGLGLSLALFPIAFLTKHYLGFGLRCLVLTIAISLWSEFTKWDVLEEGGRGALIGITLPLLLI